MNSSDVATLFLDRELKIRFFTPSSKPLFNIILSDIGRPLADLARRFVDNGLLGDGHEVLARLTPRAGAADFIEKPVSPEELLASLERVIRQSQNSQERSAWRTAQAERLTVLTDRQRQIMELVVAGHANKEIAARLGIRLISARLKVIGR